MKPLLLKISQKNETSFEVKDYQNVYFHNPIHFHEALELTYILKGKGTRFVGDHIDSFMEGDLVLIGSNIPHQWRSDIQHLHKEPDESVRAIVVHFNEGCFGNLFFNTPEFSEIGQLFERAKRGLKIQGDIHRKISHLMQFLLKVDGYERVRTFLDILHLLSQSDALLPLANESYQIKNKSTVDEKMDQIYEFIFQHLTEKITLDEVAYHFHMSKSSFCRYFKTHTQKTFSRFVLEARISLACQQLLENRLNVVQIAYDCGFNNLSYFNREFKKIKGITPLNYKKLAVE